MEKILLLTLLITSLTACDSSQQNVMTQKATPSYEEMQEKKKAELLKLLNNETNSKYKVEEKDEFLKQLGGN